MIFMLPNDIYNLRARLLRFRCIRSEFHPEFDFNVFFTKNTRLKNKLLN